MCLVGEVYRPCLIFFSFRTTRITRCACVPTECADRVVSVDRTIGSARECARRDGRAEIGGFRRLVYHLSLFVGKYRTEKQWARNNSIVLPRCAWIAHTFTNFSEFYSCDFWASYHCSKFIADFNTRKKFIEKYWLRYFDTEVIVRSWLFVKIFK